MYVTSLDRKQHTCKPIYSIQVHIGGIVVQSRLARLTHLWKIVRPIKGLRCFLVKKSLPSHCSVPVVSMNRLECDFFIELK